MLVFKRSKAVWLFNGLVFKCHSKSKQPDHSKSDKNSHHLVFYVLVPFSNVWDHSYRYSYGPDHSKMELQWGSKIGTCPDFEWSTLSGFGMVYWSQPFKNRSVLASVILYIKKKFSIKNYLGLKLDHLKSDLQNVWISNESGFRMVGFRISTVFKIGLSKLSDFKCILKLNVRY